MAEEWVMLRVKKSTAEWLKAEAEYLVRLQVSGLPNIEIHIADRHGNQPGCGYSVDALLQRWIGQVKRRRERSRRAKRGTRSRPADNVTSSKV